MPQMVRLYATLIWPYATVAQLYATLVRLYVILVWLYATLVLMRIDEGESAYNSNFADEETDV